MKVIRLILNIQEFGHQTFSIFFGSSMLRFFFSCIKLSIYIFPSSLLLVVLHMNACWYTSYILPRILGPAGMHTTRSYESYVSSGSYDRSYQPPCSAATTLVGLGFGLLNNNIYESDINLYLNTIC